MPQCAAAFTIIFMDHIDQPVNGTEQLFEEGMFVFVRWQEGVERDTFYYNTSFLYACHGDVSLYIRSALCRTGVLVLKGTGARTMM